MVDNPPTTPAPAAAGATGDPSTVVVKVPPQLAPTFDDLGRMGVALDNWHKPPLSDNPAKTEEAQALMRRPGVEVSGLPTQGPVPDRASGATQGYGQPYSQPGGVEPPATTPV